MVDGPKGGAAGMVAPGRIAGGSVPSSGSPVVAVNGVLGEAAGPAVGHAVILPMVLPETWPMVPMLIVPNAGPRPAPIVGIAPGTAAGDVMPVVGALRVDIGLVCCAKVVLQPNTTRAAVIRTRLRIRTSCV
jgi:hypothetical protein